MARIPVVTPDQATGIQKQILDQVKSQYGVVPGIYQILLTDMKLAEHAGQIYQHLNLREDASLTKVQREMVATVVNGIIGGAP